MRRGILILVSCCVVAGCGSQGVTSPAPKTVIGTLAAAPTEPVTPAFKLASKADSAAGAGVFKKAGCGGCHTLAAAHATGTVGPNFDTITPKPTFRLATARITIGKGVMPSFKGQLSDQEIANVAAYVVKSVGGTVP